MNIQRLGFSHFSMLDVFYDFVDRDPDPYKEQRWGYINAAIFLFTGVGVLCVGVASFSCGLIWGAQKYAFMVVVGLILHFPAFLMLLTGFRYLLIPACYIVHTRAQRCDRLLARLEPDDASTDDDDDEDEDSGDAPSIIVVQDAYM